MCRKGKLALHKRGSQQTDESLLATIYQR